jgi:DNA-binding HxlR family transcriptional regulator
MWALLAIVGFLAAVSVHVILCHTVSHGGALVKFLFGGSMMGAALAIQSLYRYGWVPETAASLLAYALACEFYMFLFSMVSSSISVALLLALRGRTITVSELPVMYASSGMISRRLKKLVVSGLLSQREGGYTITEKGMQLISSFHRLRVFCGHVDSPPGE